MKQETIFSYPNIWAFPSWEPLLLLEQVHRMFSPPSTVRQLHLHDDVEEN